MRVIETKLYYYNELSERAKENAREWFIERETARPLLWESEIIESIRRIEELFDIRLYIDLCGSYYVDRDTERDAEKMNFRRSIAYINNKFDFKEMPYEIRKKYPRVQWALDISKYEDVTLTGFCWDYVLYDAYKEFVESARQNGPARYTLDDFFSLLVSVANRFLQDEYKEIENEDYIQTRMELQEYEFTEEGIFYK